MITRKLATLGLGLALAFGAAGAEAAQPTAQSSVETAAPMTQTAPATAQQMARPAGIATAKAGATQVRTKVGTVKTGANRTSKLGTPKLNSGRSVAVSHRMAPSHRRLHGSMSKLKRLHRTHLAHVVKKGSSKHA